MRDSRSIAQYSRAMITIRVDNLCIISCRELSIVYVGHDNYYFVWARIRGFNTRDAFQDYDVIVKRRSVRKGSIMLEEHCVERIKQL